MRSAAPALVALALVAGCDKERSDSVRLSNQGMRALDAGDHKQAHAWFRDAVSLHPENANAHYGLGLVAIELEDMDQAKKSLETATRLKPDLVEGIYQLGWIAVEQGKLDEADAALRRVIEADPNHGPAYFLIGRLHEAKGALKEADTAFRRAITLDPYRPEGYLGLVRLYLRVGAEREALAVLREGIRVVTPDRLESPTGLALLQNELGTLLLQGGQYGEAIDALLAGIRLDGSRIEIAFNLGCAYASKGDPEMALRYFNQYIDLAGKGDEALGIAREVARHLSQRLNRRGQPSGT